MISMTDSERSGNRASDRNGLVALCAAPVCTNRDDRFNAVTGAVGQARSLKQGESLFLQGDEVRSFYVLRAGWAFRYQCLKDGKRQIVDFVLPGDVVGIGPSIQATYGVEALSACSWTIVSRESWLARLRQHPALGVNLFEHMLAAQARGYDHITSIGRRTARERIAHLLLDLARRVRKPAFCCKDVSVAMPLMLAHIGDALGLAPETVCRCLGELKRAGILAFGAGRLEILDLRGLSDIAGAPVDDDADIPGHRRCGLVA